MKGTASYADALLICQNLGELTAYEIAGDQILIPDQDGGSSNVAQSLLLMPSVSLATDEMARGIAMLGTSALGVRCLPPLTASELLSSLCYAQRTAKRNASHPCAHGSIGITAFISSKMKTQLQANLRASSSTAACARSRSRGATKPNGIAVLPKQRRCFWLKGPITGPADPKNEVKARR